MRFTALSAALLISACHAPSPHQPSCKPTLPVALREVDERPAAPRNVTLVKLPSGEWVEEVRR